MSSSESTYFPDDSDYSNGSDWQKVSMVLGSDHDSVIAATTTVQHLKSNINGVHNSFLFQDISGDPISINWISFTLWWQCTVAATPVEVELSLIDGDTGSTLHTTNLTETPTSNTAKTMVYTTPIFPYHSGTTKWTETSLNLLKLKIELVDNDTSSTSTSNYFKLYHLFRTVSTQDAGSIPTPNTYSADNSLKVMGGNIFPDGIVESG